MAYSKFGKNIRPVLLGGMFGAACCYLVAGLAHSALAAFLACIFTGLFTAMLWPGTLIMMEETLPGVGVAAYALMAAGGDLGASVAPQLMGAVIDKVSASPYVAELAAAAAGDLLISGYAGQRTASNFRKRDFYPLLERLGIDRKTPHATRHTFASWAVSAGIKTEHLQKILGHASYDTTANIYVHADAAQLVAAVEPPRAP